MAQKRMFSKDIIRTDRFLDMSLSSQALYFHLCMDADVKGFVSPRYVMRLINASVDDLNVLITKGFVIPFESGVIVITHWNVHNNVRETHEATSQHILENSKLLLSGQGIYQLQENYSSTTVELLRSIDKVSIDKVSIGESSTRTPHIKEIKYSKRSDIDELTLQELASKYDLPVDFIADCWDSACNWLDSKGVTKKNYKAFLSNWVKTERVNLIAKQSYKKGGVVDARI